MFDEIHPAERRLRDHRAVAASILAHLAVFAAILFHRPPTIELTPNWLANGSGTQSYRVIYAPDGTDAPAEEEKLALARRSNAPRHRPKPSSSKPAAEQLQVPVHAIAADRNARAGTALGTVIDGPIEGHEVHVAYPIVFPDPPVARSEVSGLQGDVVVEITIDAQGNVVETKVVQAIGHGIDEKIAAALRQWHYQPATLDGVPVASKHDVHFHFPS
ncbi:MAG TPA: TonB family protein [Terriglobales bacterium]|nr:TonB family protein [Terriglobales bacterium]